MPSSEEQKLGQSLLSSRNLLLSPWIPMTSIQFHLCHQLGWLKWLTLPFPQICSLASRSHLNSVLAYEPASSMQFKFVSKFENLCSPAFLRRSIKSIRLSLTYSISQGITQCIGFDFTLLLRCTSAVVAVCALPYIPISLYSIAHYLLRLNQ